jgi:hypothetical protein
VTGGTLVSGSVPGVEAKSPFFLKNSWMKTMLVISTLGTHCVAVGSLLMASEISLLNQLKEAGYKITKP